MTPTTATTAAPRVSDRTLRRLAKALFGVTAVMLVCTITAVIGLIAAEEETARSILPDVAFVLATFVFSLAGVVIARTQPRNAVAWVFLGVGFAWQLTGVFGAFAEWAQTDPSLAYAVPYAAMLDSWLWVPGLAPLGTFLLLLFPDGHLPTPRWRVWAWFSGVTMILAAMLMMFAPGPIDSPMTTADNPLGIAAIERLGSAAFVPIFGIPVAIAGCAIALVRRYRRSAGVQRMQLKWLAAAAAAVAVAFGTAMLASIPHDWGGGDVIPPWIDVLQNLALLSFLLIPIAVGIAITRHRLYDLDRLINRALVYGAVSALLVAVYALGVVGVGGAIRAITGQEQSNLAVAGSTLAVAALFRPFRARVQQFIDRRFYRSRYDAARTVEAFSARLRQETDLGALSDELRAVVTATVQPANVTLWIAAK